MSEWLDDGPGVSQDSDIQRHRIHCPVCRTFENAWIRLDIELTHRATEAVLPEDFKTTLFAKLEAPRPRRTAAEVTALRSQLEREHREALAALQRRYLFLDAATVLRSAAMISGLIVASVLINALARTLPEVIGSVLHQSGTVRASLTLSLSVSLAATLFSLNRVWHPFRQRTPGA